MTSGIEMTRMTPLWAVGPFVLYLLLIAGLPLVHGRFWEHNRNKLLVAAILSAPVLGYLFSIKGSGALAEVLHVLLDYATFVALLGALFTVSGGIGLRGALPGSPGVNLVFLSVGAVLSSLIGTTGASVLLIRPLLRANERRVSSTHVVVFFIFIVSNTGGLLTPLGDPPLFLGFLRGVPFLWTLRLFAQWAFVNGALLAIFAVLDRVLLARERRTPGDAATAPSSETGPLSLEGGLNFVWLLGLIGFVFALGARGEQWLGSSHLRSFVEIAGLTVLAALSFFTTPAAIREQNRHEWAPLLEVAAVFIGVFITMTPALSYLAERGGSLGIIRPAQFFWASGGLSSLLDNAPTYLAFTSLAQGVVSGGAAPAGASLAALSAHPVGERLLVAIACGSVMMGALTYIGNGPNFIVKAIAEQHHVRMPGFFGYLRWSLLILVPLFAIVSLLFF